MSFDYVFVGGGLSSGLGALALRARRPGVRVAVIEGEPALGGNHTWSFHASDLDADGHALVAPLVTQQWDAVAVRFPGQPPRTLGTGYASISSARFAEVVTRALAVEGSQAYLGRRAAVVGAQEVVLADGEVVRGALVLDARGPHRPRHFEAMGFQKFLGLEVEVDDARALPAQPVIMDADVPQLDGFRFVYTLPLGAGRALVEDTYYSDSPMLDEAALAARVHDYLGARGMRVRRELRRERGVLPIPWGHDPTPSLAPPLRLGYAGGWFHPTTGFSLPSAVAVAGTLAACPPDQAAAALGRLWRQLGPQRRFSQLLNRWLFRAVPPERRVSVFSRFYGLPTAVIERFYAGRMSAADRARIVCGRPPQGVSLKSVLFPTQAV